MYLLLYYTGICDILYILWFAKHTVNLWHSTPSDSYFIVFQAQSTRFILY